MFAGAAIATGLWMLLQLIFTGGALSAIDPEEVENARAFGIGTGIGSMLAPLLAMFAGGLLAGRLAAHWDRKVAGLHGGLVWALTSLLGILILGSAVSKLAERPAADVHADMATPPPGTTAFLEDAVRDANVRLEAQKVAKLDVDDLVNAAHGVSQAGATIDRQGFVQRLDAETNLSRPEAEAALAAFGDRAPDVIMAANQLAAHRERALAAAEATGNAMLAAGFGLLLCLAMAVGGAIIAARKLAPNNRDYDRPDTMPGHTGTPVVTDPYYYRDDTD